MNLTAASTGIKLTIDGESIGLTTAVDSADKASNRLTASLGRMEGLLERIAAGSESLTRQLASQAQAAGQAATGMEAQAGANAQAAQSTRSLAQALSQQQAQTNSATAAAQQYASSWLSAAAGPLAAAQAARAAAGATQALTEDQKRFVAGLQEQVATLGMSTQELLAYRAAQLGVSEQAGQLIAKLQAQAQAQQASAAQAAQTEGQQRFIAGLQEQVTTLGLSTHELLAYRAAQLGVSDQAAPLIASLKAQAEAGKVSAAQLANAYRMIPAQMTDIATQLAMGGNPLTALLVQGGQIKDMYGGSVGAALRGVAGYVAELVNPYTLAAAAAAALAYAAYQGSHEVDAYRQALVLSGNAAGTTAGQLQDMARAMAQANSGGTQGNAAEVLTQMAASGQVAADGLQAAAAAAIALERAGGPAASETAKQFAELGRDPVTSALRLNESLHFLTVSTYQQIKAAQEQGRTDEAASIAQKALAQAATQRGQELEAGLGTLQRAWRGVADAAKRAWDGMVGLGREQTVAQQIKGIEDRLKLPTRAGGYSTEAGRTTGARLGSGLSERDLAAQKLEVLRKQQDDENAKAASAAASAAAVEARKSFDALVPKTLTQQLADSTAQAENFGKAAGATAQEIAGKTASIRNSFDQAMDQAGRGLTAAQIKASTEVALAALDQQRTALQTARAIGLIDERTAAQQSNAIEVNRLEIQAKLVDQEIALESRRRLDLANPEQDAKAKKTRLAELHGQKDLLAQQRQNAGSSLTSELTRIDTASAQKSAQDWVSVWSEADARVRTLTEQSQTEAAQALTDPLKRAQAQAEVAVAAIQRSTDQLRLSAQNQVDMLNGRAKFALEAGQTDVAAQLQAQAAQLDGVIQKLDTATATAGAAERRKAVQPLVDDFVKGGQQVDLSAGFDKQSQAMGQVVRSFGSLIDLQTRYSAAQKAAGTNAERLAEIERVNTQQSLAGYAALVGAAKGLVKEHSMAYKAIAASEKALYALQLAEAFKTAGIKIGLIEGETAAKVGGDVAKGTSETAYSGVSIAQSLARTAVKAQEALASALGLPPPFGWVAFGVTAAMLAAIGVRVAGGGGGGASALGSDNSGTGTVLGDSKATSQSLSKSLDDLANIDTQTARYSAQMAASLKSIEGALAGVATLLIQSGTISLSAAGVQTGWTNNTLGRVNDVSRGVVEGLVKSLPVVGSVLGGWLTKLDGWASRNLGFGTQTKITGQGIYAAGQSLGDVLAGGFDAQYFTEVQKKKKFGGLTYSSSKSLQMTVADAQFEDQITKVFSGYADALKAAAAPLGANLDQVQQRLQSFVVDIGRIDTKGLTGQELQDKLTAVFSAQGDKLATAVLPGLEKFQKVGEGYLETAVRVASGVESGTLALKRLHIAAVDYTAIANQQGDVATELVRDSILAADGVNRLTDVIANLGGSAEDVASTYKQLTDVRTSLGLLGLDGSAVGADLLAGAGGLQSLADAVAAFEQGFVSADGQVTLQAQKMAQRLTELGLTMPASSEDFVALVHGIDTSTVAGRELLGEVLSLSGGFSDLLGALKDMGQGVADEIARIQGLTATGTAQTLSGAQASFSIATAQARAGDTAALDKLPSLSQALLEAAQGQARTADEYAAIQAATLASLQATLALLTDPTQRTVKVPGFATGGTFGGGLRIVGERGPELEVTGPSRIFSNSQMQTLFNGGGSAMADELRALRAEVAGLRQEQQAGHVAIAGHTRRTAETLTRLTPDGDALAVRTAD